MLIKKSIIYHRKKGKIENEMLWKYKKEFFEFMTCKNIKVKIYDLFKKYLNYSMCFVIQIRIFFLVNETK